MGHEYPDEAPKCPDCGEANPTAKAAPADDADAASALDAVGMAATSAQPDKDEEQADEIEAAAEEEDEDVASGFRRPEADTAPVVRSVEQLPPRRSSQPKGRQERAGEAVDQMAEEGLALQQALTSVLPTIAIIGSYDVGKSFFIDRLDRIAFRKGYSPDGVFQDPESDTASQAQLKSPDAAPTAVRKDASATKKSLAPQGGKVIPLTKNVHLYEYTIREGGRDFRIVDIPGEFFFLLMNPEGASQVPNIYRLEELEVRKFWEVLARTDGLILLVPAKELAKPAEAPAAGTEIDVIASAVQPLRKACQLLDQQLAEHDDDLGRAITAIQGMDARERQRLLADKRAACEKPLLVLYSKADEIVGAPSSRDAPAGRLPLEGAEFADIDPALYSALKTEGAMIQQLKQGFAVFKIDFVTAFGGLPPECKTPLPSLPHAGVWEALQWVLKRIPPRGAPRPLGPAWLRQSSWLVKFRTLVDSEFRKAL